jgi:hypothetical protein
MTYQDSNNTEREDTTFTTVLGWLAAAATAIATIASLVSVA